MPSRRRVPSGRTVVVVVAALAAAAVLAAPAWTSFVATADDQPADTSPVPFGGLDAATPADSGPAVEPSPTSPQPTDPEPQDGHGALQERLASLQIADEVWQGYDRDLFEHWTVDPATGCDTRRLVLIAQAVQAPDVGAGCRLAEGGWVSPYDQLTFTGSGAGIEIDHLVPLAEAWRSGAWAWPRELRRAFANDTRALVAVSAVANQDKLAAGPERWLPPAESSHCWYAATWIETKHRWALAVDTDERSALQAILATCGATNADVVAEAAR